MNFKLEGLNYRVERDENGRFFGHVLQQKFSGLASFEQALLYVVEKLVERTKANKYFTVSSNTLMEIVAHLDSNLGTPVIEYDFLGEKVNVK